MVQDNQAATYRWPDNPPPTTFVVHVPVVAGSLEAATRLARVLARRTATVPGTEPAAMTVSHVGDEGVRHQVFCRLALPWRRHCGLPNGHEGACRAVVRGS